jgi:hypothetical protein
MEQPAPPEAGNFLQALVLVFLFGLPSNLM